MAQHFSDLNLTIHKSSLPNLVHKCLSRACAQCTQLSRTNPTPIHKLLQNESLLFARFPHDYAPCPQRDHKAHRSFLACCATVLNSNFGISPRLSRQRQADESWTGTLAASQRGRAKATSRAIPRDSHTRPAHARRTHALAWPFSW